MIINLINLSQLQLLNSLHYNLDHYYALELISNNPGSYNLPDSVINTLMRKSLIVSHESKFTITTTGTELYTKIKNCTSYIDPKEAKKELKLIKQSLNESFLEWWTLYPSGDQIIIDGKEFSGSRAFKVQKEACEKKYIELLKEYTHADLLLGLSYDIFLKKKQCLHSGENKFKYMQNSLTYLNQKTFDSFISMAKNNKWKGSVKENEVQRTVDTFSL